MSNLIQPHDVVAGTRWLKWRTRNEQGAGAMTVDRVLDLAGRAENRGNLCKAIPWTHLFFQKSGYVGLWILGVHI
jgi:hypothetical protein